MQKQITILFFLSVLLASDRFNDELPISLTEEEKTRIHEIYTMGRDTDPPPTSIRNVAEYERMQGALIRYPFGISTSIIAEMSEDITIYCLVSSSQQNSASNSMENGDVNMDNVEFVLGNTDSYWTRDYGPWWVVDGQQNMSIVDFTYNRPRPNDNQAPLKMSNHLGVPYFATDLVHAGGNYMTDGLGISASSDLVFEENDISNDSVLQVMQDYYGIDSYHVITDPNNSYIDHIDCWAKYLSPTRVLIREVPASHPQYDEIEETADYFANTVNEWGEPWEVHRIWTPNDQPYTNSLILNEKVLVPVTGSNWDDEALAVYQEVMPGYEVLGFTGSWESTDALHCRIKGIPDLDMLQIFHNPVNDTTGPGEHGYEMEIIVDDLSEAGLIEDSIRIFWKTPETGTWLAAPMYDLDIPEEPDTRIGWISAMADTGTIQYYFQAADSSGRVEKHPLAGYHEFMALPTNVCLQWAVGDLDNSGSIEIIDVLLLTDQVISGIPAGICPGSVADINQDEAVDAMDIVLLANQILYP